MIHTLLGGFLLLVHLKTLSLVVSVGMASFWQLMHGFYWTAVGLSTQLPACSQETTYCAKKLHFRAKKAQTETAWKWYPSWSTLMNWAQMSQMSSDVHGFGRGNHMESQRWCWWHLQGSPDMSTKAELPVKGHLCWKHWDSKWLELHVVYLEVLVDSDDSMTDIWDHVSKSMTFVCLRQLYKDRAAVIQFISGEGRFLRCKILMESVTSFSDLVAS